ncbi:MAG TPA: DinB family protein, partial [Anaerolineae bacterium]|nr:DinB family protein [Anaerolineae bacterium]
SAAPQRLVEVVADLDETTLDRSLRPDTWTIRQIVHHIVDGDDLWSVAIKAAIGNPAGIFTLQWYWDVPQTTWAERWHYTDREVQPSLDLFRANRQHMVQLLTAVPEVWDRTVTIRWAGHDDEPVSVAWMIGSQARHALEHIKEIEAILSPEV